MEKVGAGIGFPSKRYGSWMAMMFDLLTTLLESKERKFVLLPAQLCWIMERGGGSVGCLSIRDDYVLLWGVSLLGLLFGCRFELELCCCNSSDAGWAG